MSREYRPDAVSGVGALVGAAIAPGKRTATEGLPARRTGVPVVDDGTACEREGGDGCFLTADQRTRQLIVIANRAGAVGANGAAAIGDTRTDTLLEKEETWGPVMEMLYYTPTGFVIGAVGAILKASANPKVIKAADHVVAGLTNLSRGGRKALQGSAAATGSHHKASKARFLELVRDQIPIWQANVVEFATSQLDDDGLVGLKDALDPAALTVSYFKEKLADMLGRFDAQQIDQVGVKDVIGYYHGELMWVGRGRQRRLVMLESKGLHHLTGSGDTEKPRDLVAKAGRDGKAITIDRDLEAMAVAMFTERTGRDPFEMDVQDAIAVGGELGRAAGGLYIDLLTMGGAQ